MKERFLYDKVDKDEQGAVDGQGGHEAKVTFSLRLSRLVDAVHEHGGSEHHRYFVHQLHLVSQRHVEEPGADADD